MKYFDLHCDTTLEMLENESDLQTNKHHISLQQASELDTYIQCYAGFVADNYYWNGGGFDHFKKHVAYLKEQIKKHKDIISFIYSKEDFENAIKKPGNYAILTMENALGLDDKIENVALVKEMGCKMITVTWNGENHFCFGADYTKGLKPLGKALIREMDKENIIIDVSHANDWGMEDILSQTNSPIVASHSNMREIWPHKRNLSDIHFKEIVRRKGLVGINFYRHFLGGEFSTVENIAKHIDYMLSLGGEDIIAMGSDFDGAVLSEGLNGIGDVPKIEEYLLTKMNYSQELVDKLFFHNAVRFFKDYFKSEGCNK